MALVDVQFRANANFADLIAQVNAANAAVKSLNTSFAMMGKSGGIDDLVREFSSGLAASRQYTTETVKLRSEAEKFGEALHKQRLELRDYHREYRNFVSGRKSMITELARQQTMLERSMVVTRGRDARGQAIADVITPTGLDNSLATKAAVARKELQIMNKVLNDGATSMINWGKNTQWAGRQLTVGLTVPLTLLGGAAAKLAYDLDKEMTRIVKVYGNTINTVMGPAATAQLRKDLMGLSGDLAKVYGQSAQETLGLAAEFAAAGKQGAELMQSVTQTTRLATLGEVDRAEAMKATLAIQTAFKSNTEELAESINFLNAVENQTNTTLNDLVEAIPKAGPIVKGLGGDIKELSLLVVAMREGGIPAAEAANALKSGLASLINPTKQAKDMLKSYNIDIDAVVNNAQGKLLPMITGFQAELDKLDEFSRQKVIEQIFGKYQFARMGALFANLGRDGSQTVEVMKLMGAEAGQLASIADRELGALQESISGQFTRALEQVKVELAQIGEGFLVLATKGLNAINWLFEKFDMLPDFVKTGFGGILTVTAIIGPIIMTTGVLGNLLGYLVKGVAWFKAFGNSGASAYDHLTTESIAAKLAGETLEKSFYDQAKAVSVLDAGINKLVASLSTLAGTGKAVETSVATTAAATAQKTKAAVASVAAGTYGRGGVGNAGAGKDGNWTMPEGEIHQRSHLIPTAALYTDLQGANRGYAQANSMISMTSGVAAELQQKMQMGLMAESIMTLDESMPDLFERRIEMLRAQASRMQLSSQDSAQVSRMIGQLTPDLAAQLLPTKQAFKEINLRYVAQLRTLAEVTSIDPALARSISAQYNKTKSKMGGAAAWAELNNRVVKDYGDLFNENYQQMQQIYRDAQRAENTVEGQITYLRRELDRLELEARQRITQSGAKIGTRGTIGTNQAGSTPFAIQANENIYYGRDVSTGATTTTGGIILSERAVRELKDAAEESSDAAKTHKTAAGVQMGAAIIQEEAAIAGGSRGGLTFGDGTGIAGRTPGRGGFWTRAKGIATGKVGKGVGAAAGIGLMTAGLQADGGLLGSAGTVAGGALTGGMFGSMFGPPGMAIGAGIGAITAAVPLLVQNVQRANDELAAAFATGETAVDKMGAAIKSASDVALIPFSENAKVAKTAVEELTAAIKAAEEGSEDANFRELLAGEEDQGNMLGLLKDKVLALKAAGVEAQQIREYIIAALTAAGKMGEAASLMPELMSYAEGNLASTINDQLAKYNDERRRMEAYMRGSGIEAGNSPIVDGQALEDAESVFKLLQDFAATAPPVELERTISGLAAQLPRIGDVMAVVPDNFKQMAETIASSGGDSEDILKAISLATQGVAIDMERVSRDPYYIDIIFRQTMGTQEMVSGLGSTIESMFTARNNEINKMMTGETETAKANNDARIKAQEDYIDKLRDKYDDQIEAEKKKQEALDEAQEAEERRLNRQKTLRDLQVSYNEAIASGNFGAAALIKNEVAYTKAEWGREDKERIADKASESRIEAIEKERDAAIESEQAKLDAMRENQESMTSVVTNGAKLRAKQEQDATNAAYEAYKAALAKYPGDFGGLAQELLAKEPLFKAAGIDIGTVIKAELVKQVGVDAANGIFNQLGNNLQIAPWDKIMLVVEGKLIGGKEGNEMVRDGMAAIDKWRAIGDAPRRDSSQDVAVLPGTNKRVPLFAGGLVSGPGHGVSDDVDAKLSNGEFVMTNASVNYYGKGFMDAINQRKFASGGLVEPIAMEAAYRGVMTGINNFGSSSGPRDVIFPTSDLGATGVAGGGPGGVAGTGLGAQIAALGARYVGVPYSYTGGSPEDGWGCAPFVRWVYQRFGFNLPGGSVSNSQYNAIKSRPNRNEITAGDLLFFKYANGVNLQNPINHVGLYMGGGRMVHAANKQKGTIISGVDWNNYVAAGRPIDYDTRKPNYARGGLVGMIEPGEFMVNKEATQHYGEGFLNAINQQTYHKGGLVTPSGPKHGLASGGGNQYNFTVYGDQKSAKELAREVVALIEQTNKRKRSNR